MEPEKTCKNCKKWLAPNDDKTEGSCHIKMGNSQIDGQIEVARDFTTKGNETCDKFEMKI